MSERFDRRDVAVSLVAGLLFGAGLVVSGMTRPDRVIGFLDVLGGWDPTLGFVLAGATGSHMLLRPLIARLAPAKVAAGTPSRTQLDRPLLVGSAMFGAGWGLGGYCPGPAITAAIPALGTTALFVGSMVFGMALHKAWVQWERAKSESAQVFSPSPDGDGGDRVARSSA